MKRLIILGGGASGIAAAVSAAELLCGKAEVLLLERGPRVGKKLLATGNGRCNFGNAAVSPERYFTGDKSRAEALLRTIEGCSPAQWLAGHGLLSREEDGRLYPYSNQAADLLNLLLYWLEKTGIRVETGRTVVDIFRKGDSFGVLCETGEKYFGEAVICAMGGSAAPQFGADGAGFELARRCGCRLEPLYPCLVPLKCDRRQISGLSGIRVRASASLVDDGSLLHREQGEIQFTDYGLSGIAVMQLSGFLSPKSRLVSPQISLDLFPQMAGDELSAMLFERARLFDGGSVQQLFIGLLNRRIASAVCRRLGLGDGAPLSDGAISALAETLKDWRFDRPEPVGWQQAQTTGGGIALSQIETESFGLDGCEGLYFVGETLDCAGFCGGFNLHWAFGSGIAAGRHAAGLLLKSPKSAKKRRRDD